MTDGVESALPPPRNGRHSSDEWLIALVKTMIVSLLDERDHRYQERFESQNTALLKSEQSIAASFEKVNEFRKALSDRDILYMPRSESDAQYKSATDKMDAQVRENTATHEGINKRIESVVKRVDTFEGTLAGSRTMLVSVGGIAAFLVASIIIGTFVFSSHSPPDQQSVAAAAAAAAVLATAAAAAKVAPPTPQLIYLTPEQLNKLTPPR